MAKGNLPNNNTSGTANSIGLNKMESTGNQAPWQQMANQNVSYPGGITQQGGLGPSSTNVLPFANNPMAFNGQQSAQNGFFNKLAGRNGSPVSGGGNNGQLTPKPGGLMPSLGYGSFGNSGGGDMGNTPMPSNGINDGSFYKGFGNVPGQRPDPTFMRTLPFSDDTQGLM